MNTAPLKHEQPYEHGTTQALLIYVEGLKYISPPAVLPEPQTCHDGALRPHSGGSLAMSRATTHFAKKRAAKL